MFQITLPALRDRKKDIDLLAAYFLNYFAVKINKPVTQLHPSFREALHQHAWKGNIRELKNVLERAVILAETDTLSADQLPFDIWFATAAPGQTAFDLETVEKQHMQKVLTYTHGNKTETARLLNIGLTTLYRKIQEFKLGE